MENYQTASANSIKGEDIITLLNQEKPQLLILDFHLGSRDAIQHVTTIRDDEYWRSLPLLITSAIDRSQECLEAGANGFILKPFNWQEVSESVNEIYKNSEHKEV
jgi:two-component system sensor histidine kinase ChiS